MAVYEQRYTRYTGPLTRPWTRWLVPARYAYTRLTQSRMATSLLLGCAVWPLVSAGMIYLRYNSAPLKLIGLNVGDLLAINPAFFLRLENVQTGLGFMLVLFLGPNLIAADLANGGLPLYLSRPLNRVEYLLGKLAVLGLLLSAVTWIPGLVLYGLQSALAGGTWWIENLPVAAALVATSWMWIVTLSLGILALSALVRRAPVAAGGFLGVMFVLRGFSAVLGEILDVNTLYVLSPLDALWVTRAHLFGPTTWNEIFGPGQAPEAVGLAWGSLFLLWALCLAILARKVRPFEVVT